MLLQLSRQPHVALPGRAPTPLAPRDAALLAWLALEGPTARSRLAELLWPDSAPDAARNTLRQRLFQLKRLCGELVVGSTVLALAPEVVHDLADAEELLADCGNFESPELTGWLATQRERLQGRLRQSLLQLADHAEQAQQWPQALVHAQELLALEPLSEDAHRRLIRLHYLAGDRAAALLAFDRCERVLKHEVGTRPSPETMALLALIEQAPRTEVAPMVGLVRPPRLVGRSRELAALRAAAGSGLHAMVVGEGGMGKSRLLAEFAGAQGEVAQVGARPGDADRPYALFARLVRALPPPSDATQRAELARFVPELGTAARAQFEQGRFDHAAERWLCGLPPLPLVIDDLHFADDASVELLTRLAAVPALPPLVLGLRPVEGGVGLAQLQQTLSELPRCHRIVLPPLGVAELAELIDSLALPQLRGETLAESLCRHAGGNPQFALETLRTLLVEGVPAGGGGALPLPAGVGAVIERRLKRLSPAALKLARLAAVAQGDFTAPLAAQVLGLDLLDLADPWAELEAAQVLSDRGFAHDLVFEAVRAGVPKAVARPLHAGVARALEGSGGAVGAIARHWLAAGELERAVTPLRDAATQAHEASRPREAAEFFAALADVHQRRGDRPAQLRALMDRFGALYEMDSGAGLDAVLDQAEALAGDDGERAHVLEGRARLAAARWDVDGGEPIARRAIELARRAGDAAVESDSRVVLAQLLLKKRRPDEAAAVLAGLQEWIEREAPFEQRWLYEECVAWLVLEQERYREGLRQWERVAEMSIERGAMSQLALALSYQMLCLGYSGRFGRAAQVGERERELTLEHHLFGPNYALVDLNLAHVYTLSGRFADALQALDRAEGVPGVHRSTLAMRRALLYLALGQPGRARPFAERAVHEAQGDVQRHAPMLAQVRVLQALGTREDDAHRAELMAEAQRLSSLSVKAATQVRTLLVEAEGTRAEQRLTAADHALALLAGSELFGLQISAHARRAQALMECQRSADALQAVEALLALNAMEPPLSPQTGGYAPELMSVGEVALIACQVLQAHGDARAARVLRAAGDWLHRTAADHVPPEFRESFLQRVPAHRELLAAASLLPSSEMGALSQPSPQSRRRLTRP